MEKFVIVNGNRFMKRHKNKFQPTDDINQADNFTYDEAYKIFTNMLSKTQKMNWSISPLSNFIKIKSEENKAEEPSQQPNTKTIFDSMDYDWTHTISEMQALFSGLEPYKKTLVERYREIEDEQQDILHLIEFYKFDAASGYKFAKKLQDIRKRRRQIKDEMFRVNIMFDSDLDDIKSGRCVSRIKGLDNREYTPRRLTDIFKSA